MATAAWLAKAWVRLAYSGVYTSRSRLFNSR